MVSFPEGVLNEVVKQVELPDEFLEYLYTLLLAEQKKGYPTLYNKPDIISQVHVDVYAYTIIQLLKSLKSFDLFQEGLQVSIADLLGWSMSELTESQSHIPPEFRLPEPPESRGQRWTLKKYVEIFGRVSDVSQPHTVNALSTFWLDLLTYQIGVKIPHKTRRLHTHIIGATNSGKTQLIQELISYDLETGASIIVIDSQKDLINKLKYSKLIPEERLIIIEPEDSVKHPLALNMFHMDVGYSHADPVELERQISGVVEQLNFVFAAIMDSALTDKQSVLFKYCIRLLLSIPDSTIFTLQDILKMGVSDYQQYIDMLPKLSRDFFDSAFPSNPKHRSQFSTTREEILRRLYDLLENPSISRIFGSTENKLDLGKEMNEGKVILISTDKSLLMQTGCAFFGRYFLSLIAQATQNRANKPESQRKPVYVYVDEFGDYVRNSPDTNVTDILEQGRKYNVSLTIAHQHSDQLPYEVLASLHTNSGTKFAGRISVKDERMMKTEMRIDHISREKLVFSATATEFLNDFTVHVRPGIIENAPRRTQTEMNSVIRENRAKYCVDSGTSPVTQKTPEIPPKQAKSDEASAIPEDDMEDWNAL